MPRRASRGRPQKPKRERPTDPIAERQGNRLRLLHSLKEDQENRKITQTEIGEIIGATTEAYGSYERGRIRIPYELLVPLSRYYGVSVLYLLGLSDEPGLPRDYSDEARLVCDQVNQMSPEAQRLMVTWSADQLKLDRQRQAARASLEPSAECEQHSQ